MSQTKHFETDKPEVRSTSLSLYRVDEGQTATLVCVVTDANPNTNITWRWFKSDTPNIILHIGPNYTITNIQRGRSGLYGCSSSNIVGTSEAVAIEVDVQCKWLCMYRNHTLSPVISKF